MCGYTNNALCLWYRPEVLHRARCVRSCSRYSDALPATHPINAVRYIRFMQWGVFSAIFRPHDGGNADTRIWTFEPEHYRILRDYTRLRGALTPWVYALAAKTRMESLPFTRPMWWDFSSLENEQDIALNAHDFPAGADTYDMVQQYMFGDSVLVRPISEFVSPSSAMPPFSTNETAVNSSTYSVWIPPGCWLNWNASTKFCGPVMHTAVAQLHEIPLFVMPGTVLPMWPPGRRENNVVQRVRVWAVFIDNTLSTTPRYGDGSDYEDDGASLTYAASATRLSFISSIVASTKNNSRTSMWFAEFNVSTEGTYDGMPSTKQHALQIRGIASLGNSQISCCVGDQPCTHVESGVVGNYTIIGSWIVPASIAEMATPAGALVIVCPPIDRTQGLRILVRGSILK